MATKIRSVRRETGNDQASRLAFALRMLPERKRAAIGTPEKVVATIAADDTLSHSASMQRLRNLIRVSGELQVDPRWLALGTPSPAAWAAIATARRWPGQYTVAASKVEELIEILKTTIQPDRFPGTCRYCFCTDGMGCGDCVWIDGPHTICSAWRPRRGKTWREK